MLIGDLAGDPYPDVDELIRTVLLPTLVAKVADSKVVVRKAASQALVSYMQSTREPEEVMRCLLRTGLEAQDWRQRQVGRSSRPPSCAPPSPSAPP